MTDRPFEKQNEIQGVSIIIPFLNEADGIELCCRTMDERVAQLPFPVELIFVDDGSTDESVSLLKKYRFRHPSGVRLVRFSRNFGSHAAIRAGILNSTYDICTWLGSDLQEPLRYASFAEGSSERARRRGHAAGLISGCRTHQV